MPVSQSIAYHLFTIDAAPSKSGEVAKLCRKAKWPSQTRIAEIHSLLLIHFFKLETLNASLDFNSTGELMVEFHWDGMVLISNVNTSAYSFHWDFKSQGLSSSCIFDPSFWISLPFLKRHRLKCYIDWYGHCRWSTNPEEAFLYIRHFDETSNGRTKLSLMDVEKKALLLTRPINLDDRIECNFWATMNNPDSWLISQTFGTHYVIVFAFIFTHFLIFKLLSKVTNSTFCRSCGPNHIFHRSKPHEWQLARVWRHREENQDLR